MSLSELLNEWSETSFDYHGHDCCRFAASISELITGRYPMDLFDYDGKLEAYRLIKKHGSLESVITETLGDPISIKDCSPGDIASIEMPDGQVLASVVLKDTLVAKTEKRGICFFPKSDALNVWSVSCQVR